MDKVTVVRALASRVGLRMVRLVTIIVCLLLLSLLVGIWALAHFFSAWWWLLLIPLLAFAVVFVILRFIVRVIAHSLYRSALSKSQKKQLDAFIDKIIRLAETRSTPPFVFALLTMKDILFNRDITTIKGIVRDSTTLKADFERLQRDLSRPNVIDR